MNVRVGVGYSDLPSSKSAAIEATSEALTRLGGQSPRLAMVFATSKVDEAELASGVTSVIGDGVPWFGGSAAGAITNGKLGYGGAQIGIALWAGDELDVAVFSEGGLDERGEALVGRALGDQIRAAGYATSGGLVVLYDSVRNPPPNLVLNVATHLVDGLGASLERWPAIAGMGVMGDFECRPTRQYAGARRMSQSAAALAVRGLRMQTAVMHGCYPVGSYHRITRADGPCILEIDGAPALDRIAELLGPDSSIGPKDYPFFLTLGVNHGERFGDFRDEDYASRLCMGVDEARRALVMFEPDLTTGSEIQLMKRQIDFDYLATRTRALIAQAVGRPVFALYIDCMGRAANMTGWAREEATEVQRAIGDIPLLGLYSGVEIAKVGPAVRALDWTGVLCLFSEDV